MSRIGEWIREKMETQGVESIYELEEVRKNGMGSSGTRNDLDGDGKCDNSYSSNSKMSKD